MERGIMTINRNGVTITGNVWITDLEIAELFQRTPPGINQPYQIHLQKRSIVGK